MDWRDFAASLVSSLAWPATVLLIILMLRQQIVGFVHRLQFDRTKRMAVGPSGIDLEFFDRQIGEVREVLTASDNGLRVAASAEAIAEASSVEQERITRFLDVSPGVAVVGAFIGMEVSFRDLAKRAGHDAAERESLGSVLGWLHREALIGTDTYEAALGMLRTRNEIIHGQDEIDRSRALEYLRLTSELESRIRSVDVDPSDPG